MCMIGQNIVKKKINDISCNQNFHNMDNKVKISSTNRYLLNAKNYVKFWRHED